MAIELEQKVIEGLRQLPDEQQQEVAAFVEDLIRQKTESKTVWDRIDAYLDEVLPADWDKTPADGSKQHDHYLYGSPKI